MPTCRVAGQLPAGCRRVARGAAGRSLGKRCRPRGAADVPRSRPVADVLPVVLPARQLPAGCPHAPGRSLGKPCRPRGAAPVKIGPTLPARGAADVLRSRPVADVLPVVLPARHSGSVAGPVVLPTYRAARQLFYMRRFSGAFPALPFHLLDSLILDSALRGRVNRYNPTHFHYFYGLFCCFRTWQAAICP